MTLEQLLVDPAYRYYHTASRRGYVSRCTNGMVLPYRGRFGAGYIVLTPRRDTSRYVWCSYYIMQD